MNLDKGINRIDHPQSPFIVADETLYEILHALWADRRLPDRASEERAVTELAQGLAGVFRDNPGLLTYIEQLVDEAR